MTDILPFDNLNDNENTYSSQNQLGNQFQAMMKFKMINNALS